jgi:hypothetical protein
MVPVRTVQEAVAAGDLPSLDADAADVFSRSERILQDHVGKHNTDAADLKDLIQRVLHHPDFNADEVDHDMHELPLQSERPPLPWKEPSGHVLYMT